ncbi:hypothetical protein BDR06DRAFT_970285 [Suillus hirtellus]|nr:hypothetical protein BDR06DRAFT_970285 [Suillus hirtellus]
MATSCKVASKHAKLKDAQPAQRVPPPTRTASGRQRCPTEKENYHVSESQHVTYRQETKEKKIEKQKKKALRAAYDADPDGFEEEPSELHSDIDRAEENMFLDCDMVSKLSQSKSKVLTFSAGKIPPVLRNASAMHKATTTAPTLSPSNDSKLDESTDHESRRPEDHIDDEDNDYVAEELSPIARGSKRPLDDSETLDDGMVLPKIKKNSDGSRHRMKVSDFDDVSKEILGTAACIFQCLIVSQAPFPENIAVEMQLAKAAWHEACQIKGINVKMNRDLAESLKDSSVFAFKDWKSKKGIYKMELLQLGINIMWFTNQHDEGVIHHKYFNPMPVEVIALVLTTIKCCIDEWLQGLKEDIKFTLATYGTVYHGHFCSLQRFNKRMAPYKLLDKIRVNLHDVACVHAGVDTLTISLSASRISDMAFKDAIQEYQLEEQDDAEASES